MTGFRRYYLINELLRNGTWLENAVTVDRSLNYMSPPPFLSVSQASWPHVGWGLALTWPSTVMLTSVQALCLG